MIMVGPGTGIAPFRGFLQERRALGQPGRNWLFFGEQHRAENFYYRDELEDMPATASSAGSTWRSPVTRRDKVYVQDRMLDYGADCGAGCRTARHFYVCGDATRMAKDVDAALTTIIRDARRDVARAGPRFQARAGGCQTLRPRRVLTTIATARFPLPPRLRPLRDSVLGEGR